MHYRITVGQVRPVLMSIGQFGEQLCIAVIGSAEAHGFWARAITPKPLPNLPGDLGHALSSFGSIVVADFLEWCTKGRSIESWTAPLGGLNLGSWLEVAGADFDDLVRVSVAMAGLGLGSGDVQSFRPEAPSLAPRTSDENRFLQAVRTGVASSHPDLADRFHRDFSLTGKTGFGEIDFVGSGYVTCYAAINPRSRSLSRAQTASAALWRLARARDAFGFAAPSAIELTAWVPPPDLPIFSAGDYTTVAETIAELKAQAQKEALDVFPVFDVPMACRRLVQLEFTHAHH